MEVHMSATRRSFLQFLGLAPAAAVVAVQAQASPAPPVEGLLEAQAVSSQTTLVTGYEPLHLGHHGGTAPVYFVNASDEPLRPGRLVFISGFDGHHGVPSALPSAFQRYATHVVVHRTVPPGCRGAMAREAIVQTTIDGRHRALGDTLFAGPNGRPIFDPGPEWHRVGHLVDCRTRSRVHFHL